MRQTKTGILLANLGTPDAPTPEAVKTLSETIFKRQTRG
ncbi:ferrochelatase [Escherichia coli]|uniref:Ferrochelatase n=1 Tax=Escherichia coli TaxID=562 RepID=A0A377DW09_ECOLX|nr:ferrochelatase [Escherichia coli]